MQKDPQTSLAVLKCHLSSQLEIISGISFFAFIFDHLTQIMFLLILITVQRY